MVCLFAVVWVIHFIRMLCVGGSYTAYSNINWPFSEMQCVVLFGNMVIFYGMHKICLTVRMTWCHNLQQIDSHYISLFFNYYYQFTWHTNFVIFGKFIRLIYIKRLMGWKNFTCFLAIRIDSNTCNFVTCA